MTLLTSRSLVPSSPSSVALRAIARALHAHGAFAVFDYAAAAPYVAIDMHPGPPGERIDALDAASVVKRGLIQVMEGRHCFPHLTVEENLLTGAYTRADGRLRVAEDLGKVYSYFPRLKVRRSATAILIVIVAIVVPFVLSAPPGIPTGLTEWLLRITPAAAFALQQPAPQYYQVQANYIPSSGYFPLAPWAGFAVLCGWTALALILAAYLLCRRDA